MQNHDRLIPTQNRNSDILSLSTLVRLSRAGLEQRRVGTRGLFKGSLPLQHRRPHQRGDRTAGVLTVWITGDRFSPCGEVLLLPNSEPLPPTACQSVVTAEWLRTTDRPLINSVECSTAKFAAFGGHTYRRIWKQQHQTFVLTCTEVPGDFHKTPAISSRLDGQLDFLWCWFVLSCLFLLFAF